MYEENEELISKAFQVVDKDQDGSISVEEFLDYMGITGSCLTQFQNVCKKSNY